MTTSAKSRFEAAAPPGTTRQTPRSGWLLLVGLVFVIPMSGCDDAVITYKQIGVCHHYVDPTAADLTEHFNAAPAYYVLFQVDSVDTSGSQQDFHFAPARFTVGGGAQEVHVDQWLTDALAGPFAGAAGVFPAGQAPPGSPSTFIVAAEVSAAPGGQPVFSLTYAAPPQGVPDPNPNLTVLTLPDAQTPPNEQYDCKDVMGMN